MPPPQRKPRIAVLSPFVDKRHGTERCLAEQIDRLAGTYEIHLYSNEVDDIDLERIIWHRVPMPPGPHLVRYVFWLVANRFCRWRDAKFRGLKPDLVYSPGVNGMDANLVCVHEVFARVRRSLSHELELHRNPINSWHLLIHRRVYYRVAEFLERRMYSRDSANLIAVSEKLAADIRDLFGRRAPVNVLYSGLDSVKFSRTRRLELRKKARAELGLSGGEIAILLIGNDWKKKGLTCLLEATGKLRNPNVRVLVVGRDTQAPYKEMISRLGLTGRVEFLPPRPDVEFYYAAADACVMPSLGESFSLPPGEAMACGLPVITSRAAGVSEIIHHGKDGLILENPADSQTLSEWLGRLASDHDWRRKLGEAGTRTAARYTWDENARQLSGRIEAILQRRSKT
jgi:UDP-glucose:(heptosyl)LPS alpha-1,3-glucosyltransferase